MKPELSSQDGSDSGLNCYERDRTRLKQLLPLFAAIFFVIAPSPDSHDIAELTANFIAAASQPGTSSFKTGG